MQKGISNLIRWFPIIWRDEDWDWEYLAEIMEFKFRNMAKHFREYGCHVGSDEDAKDLLTCAELLKRLRDDDCIEKIEGKRIPYRLHETRMKEWQQELGDMIGKKMRCWWD